MVTGMTGLQQQPVASEELLDALLESIEDHRGLGQYSRERLRRRLCEVLFPEESHRAKFLEWLSRPFLQALLRGDDTIHTARIQPPGKKEPGRSLLFWLCQWGFLRAEYGWKGGDDMVLLALRFGAKVQVEEGEMSVLAGAIQHGTVDTVLHLLRTQQPNEREWIHREAVLHDIWRRALHRACPRILQVLLRYISAEERVWIGTAIHVTAVDYLLHRVAAYHSKHYAEDIGQCLLQLLKQGVAYTSRTMKIISAVIFEEPENSAAYKIAQMLFGNWMPQIVRDNLAKERGQQVENRKFASESQAQVCVICLEDPKPTANKWKFPAFVESVGNPTISLYCGHSFCLLCIRRWGASEPENLRPTRTVELSCPICRKPLPREVLSGANRRILAVLGDRRRNYLGLDPTQHYPPGPRGPQLLSRLQIAMECEARGIPTDSYEEAAETLARQWNQVRQQRKDGPTIMVDLGVSRSLSPDYVAPKLGAAVIPILVQGIPMLAGISGSSPYTVVTPDVVELLGLKARGLASNEFQIFQHCHTSSDDSSNSSDENDEPTIRRLPTRMAVIEELVITLGRSKIEVRLRNAVMPCEDAPIWRPGIVLGIDFMESAAWTQTAVEVDVAGSIPKRFRQSAAERRFMILLHGGMYIRRVVDRELAATMPEEFRYYAFNGRTFRTQLLHIQPHSDGKSQNLFISVKHPTGPTMTASGRRKPAFTECEWCCRMFHFFLPIKDNESNQTSVSGMVRCNFCRDLPQGMREHIFYCDKNCQQLAYEAHAHRHGEYSGMLVVWSRFFARIVFQAIWRQRRVFSLSFLLGFAASFLASRWERPPVQQMWAQSSLLRPRVE